MRKLASLAAVLALSVVYAACEAYPTMLEAPVLLSHEKGRPHIGGACPNPFVLTFDPASPANRNGDAFVCHMTVGDDQVVAIDNNVHGRPLGKKG